MIISYNCLDLYLYTVCASATSPMAATFLSAVATRSIDSTCTGEKLAARLADPTQRRAAIETLGEYGLTSADVPLIVPFISDSEVAFQAASLLCVVPPQALLPHVAKILDLFESVPDDMRWRVVEALSKLDPDELGAHGDSVARLMGSSQDDSRRRALELMASLPPAVIQQHAPAAISLLDDEDEDCRLGAVELLGGLPPEALAQPPLLPALRRVMADDEEGCVRMGAVGALSKLPVGALTALAPDLMARLEDSEWRVRRHVSEVLAGFKADALAPHADAVLQRLGHTDARVREWAIATFAKLASALESDQAADVGARAATALKGLLNDEDRRVRERATWLGAKLAGNLAPAAPVEALSTAETPADRSG